MKIQRYPKSSNNSLKAWSAADEFLLQHLKENDLSDLPSIAILNDRFGYLSVNLQSHQPNIIIHFKSQEEAIVANHTLNNLEQDKLKIHPILETDSDLADFVVLKVPKSMDLFHLFLLTMHKRSKPTTKVFCGFMTRHFTKQMLAIASIYFEQIEQSLAWKKSRVLSLSSPKQNITYTNPLHKIPFNNSRNENLIFDQYYGVFSARHIDYATQFLLENLEIKDTIKTVLDLASGNGVIAHEVRSQSKDSEVHLIDDSYLAIESSKLNLKEGTNFFHYNHTMHHLKDDYFDLILCNPPFHFEHENTIDIALNMFHEAARILHPEGSFILVANLHLNYKTHLSKIFEEVSVINMNAKFEIIECCLST